MPALTLYRANGACSFVPHALLKELSVPFTSVLLKRGSDGLEAADGDFTNAEYRQTIHPYGYVPALKMDDAVITEMPAILTYIASLQAEKNLAGSGGLQRAKVVEWMAWLSGSLHGVGFGMRFRPGRFADDMSLHPAIRQRGKDFVGACFARIDYALTGKTFAVGAAETIVDYNLIIFWYWGIEIGFQMLEQFPNYGQLVRRMELKDSVREVAEIEGMELSYPTLETREY